MFLTFPMQIANNSVENIQICIGKHNFCCHRAIQIECWTVEICYVCDGVCVYFWNPIKYFPRGKVSPKSVWKRRAFCFVERESSKIEYTVFHANFIFLRHFMLEQLEFAEVCEEWKALATLQLTLPSTNLSTPKTCWIKSVDTYASDNSKSTELSSQH